MSMEEDAEVHTKTGKKSNVLPLWGNERTMNMNNLILTNIQASHYFKMNLYELKTYHEVVDEIYYKVSHLEPWEKGSRKTAGQTGMCGGVRGVGAGGIVSTAYCLLYKLFTLKLTRKQLNGLLTHPDSPFIRGLGFMYIRYTQPPADLWDWYDEFLEDEEELDVKAGGGQVMTIGNMLRHFLTKLEWFSTLFPRIPVPIQQKLERQLSDRFPAPPPGAAAHAAVQRAPERRRDFEEYPEERVPPPPPPRVRRSPSHGRDSPAHKRSRTSPPPNRSVRHKERRSRSRSRDRERERHGDRGRNRDRSSRNGHSRHHKSSKDDHSRHRSHSSRDYASELLKERERQRRERDGSRSPPPSHR
ncbi:Hypothetical predicted protein [Cloeon dipterum]|uniref:Pre-mRNA-splicing factor 38 n=2 Tax=Cloeon dipterum TaxID=197152 RepID=A0A8S1D878_9INSE|nr:Hypothetical predicted protein [Cloeon dipterum]